MEKDLNKPANEKPDELNKPKKRSIMDNPIQRRIFEKMGTVYKVEKPKTDKE